ncbi:MAG TPA: glycosyltransferase family 39 protein [Dehalococcoidales bacterium]|nr:glycosyltransferase family 39 protein [Dehalococcoidales bacterium]
MKQKLRRIIRWEFLWLCLILITTLAMRFSVAGSIEGPILDEVYYAGHFDKKHGDLEFGNAHSILVLQKDARPEHPPLGKLFVAAGVKILGDNEWGWRVPSIIMGTISIALFFFICRRLGMSRLGVNLATFLFAFENMTFMLGSIAMLDVFFVTFMLAFFLLYLHRRYILSGIFIGLSAAAKLFGVMGAPSLLIHWLFTRQKHSRWFAATVIAAPIAFLAAVTLFDFVIARQFVNPIDRIKDMLTLSGSLTFYNVEHPNMSRPWEWLLNFRPMGFWYGPFPTTWLGGYTAAVSLAVWPLIVPLVLYMAYRAAKGSDAGLFGLAWFIGTFILWIPISIATNRVSFIFYFYPTLGAFCLGLGMALAELIGWLKNRRKRVKIPIWAGICLILLVHIATLVVLTPIFIRG